MKKRNENVDYGMNKEFIDRLEDRKRFWEWYEKAYKNRDDYFVLSYYGIAGIGKSSLINQLCRELTEKSGIYVKFDFEYINDFDPYSILLGLKQTLRNKYQYNFPLFNSALIILAKKSNIIFENDEVIKSIVSESPHLQRAVDAISLIPLLGGYLQNAFEITAQLFADIDNLKTSVSLKKKYKQMIEEMPKLEADELRSKMPQYFWNDMIENLRYSSKPLVIFLDTYEKYIDTFKEPSNVILDSWLREGPHSLIRKVPGILWVISGWEKLSWKEEGEWDDDHLGCFEVKDFTISYSEKYLQNCGMTDETLISHICKSAQGVPLYLTLCADTYYLFTERGITPSIENFTVDQRKIVNEYIKYLDSINRDLVLMLAAMDSWRDEEAKYVGRNLSLVSFSVERYKYLLKHSFFKRDEIGKNRMHEIVRNAIVSEIDTSTLEEVNALLFHYRVGKLYSETIAFVNIVSGIKEAVDVFCKLHRDHIYEEQFNDFCKLKNKITEIIEHGYVNHSLSISSKLRQHCEKAFDDTAYYAFSIELEGSAYWAAGKYNEALADNQLLYSIASLVCGDDDEFTLGALHNLGILYCELGHFEKALNVHKQVYESFKNKLGQENPYTLSALHSIGLEYNALGHYKNALRINKNILEIQKRKKGKDHPDTLNTLFSIARVYDGLGNYKEALIMDKRVYKMRRIMLGKEHPDTISSLNSLSSDYIRLGCYDKALKTSTKEYKIRKCMLGDEHPDTLHSLQTIGLCYHYLGRYEEALKVINDVYKKMEYTLGNDHSDTLLTLHNIGLIFRTLGKYEEALCTDKKVYEGLKNVLGIDHPHTLRSRHSISMDYQKLERYEDALKIDKQVYKDRKRVLGENHPETLLSLYSIGAGYRKLHYYEKALKVDKRVYKDLKDVLGDQHPDTLQSLYSLGEDYGNLNLYEEKLRVDKHLYEIRKQLIGEDHPETLEVLFNIGIDLSSLGQYEKSIVVFKQVYKKQKRVLGEDHPDTINSLHSIGVDYGNLSLHEKSIVVFKQVYDSQKHILGENHSDTLSCLENIGVVYFKLERYEDALEVFKQVYESRRLVLGMDDAQTLYSMYELARAYSSLGRNEEALELDNQVKEALRLLQSED